jgi:plasmid replication initiation protein
MIPAARRRQTKTLEDSQLDLFIALPSDIPARDQQDLMERPFGRTEQTNVKFHRRPASSIKTSNQVFDVICAKFLSLFIA